MLESGEILLPGMPPWLPFEQTPDGFDQEYAHMFIALPIDWSEALHSPTGIFARATAGVTADGFAMFKTMPVTYFAIEQSKGERAQTGWYHLLRDPGLERSAQLNELSATGADLRDKGLELFAHKTAALERESFPFAWPSPATGQSLMFELDSQRPSMVLQSA